MNVTFQQICVAIDGFLDDPVRTRDQNTKDICKIISHLQAHMAAIAQADRRDQLATAKATRDKPLR